MPFIQPTYIGISESFKMKKREKKNKMKISQNRLNIEYMFGLANKFLVLMDLIVKLFSHINL